MLFYVWVRIYTGQHSRYKIAGLKGYCICNFDGSCDIALHSSYANLLSHRQHMRGPLPPSLTTTVSISQVLLPSQQFTWFVALTCPEEVSWLACRWSVSTDENEMRTWCSTPWFPEHFPPLADGPLVPTPSVISRPAAGTRVFQRTALSQHLWRGKCLEKYVLPQGIYFLQSLMSTGE